MNYNPYQQQQPSQNSAQPQPQYPYQTQPPQPFMMMPPLQQQPLMPPMMMQQPPHMMQQPPHMMQQPMMMMGGSSGASNTTGFGGGGGAGGGGPLAGQVPRVGANGLLMAPEEPKADVHEAMEFMKLSVAEGVQYDAYWTDACKGEETISGKDAAEFLGRASGVSRSQLKLIWSIADHNKEGFLDRDGFFIALRLVALAQRGAEIGVAGLRNFKGIMLVPEIKSVEKVENVGGKGDGGVGSGVDGLVGEVERLKMGNSVGGKDGFSWWVEKVEVEKYDRFFNELDSEGVGFIDGKQGVTFFMKSGLPKASLRKIWQLADVKGVGKLSRDDFRNAMHLVTAMRRGKLAEAGLPDRLDPSGPNWLRVVGEAPPQSAAPQMGMGMQEQQGMQGGPIQQSVPQSAHGLQQGDASGVAPANLMDDESHANMHPQNGMGAGVAGGGQRSTWEEDPEELRERLRREKLDAARAKREMEDMRREMERLRQEKAQFSNSSRSQNVEVEEMRRAYEDMAAAKEKAEQDALRARDELNRKSRDGSAAASLSPLHEAEVSPRPSTVGRSVPLDASLFDEPKRKSPARRPPRSPASSSRVKAPQSPSHYIPPSPVIAPVPSGQKVHQKTQPRKVPPPRVLSKDSLTSSDDDEDDFWGTGGLAPARPSLGAAVLAKNAPQNPVKATAPTTIKTTQASATKVETKPAVPNTGFGNDLDDWTF